MLLRLLLILLQGWLASFEEWKCPEVSELPSVECSCDIPHTLRCTGDKTALHIIGRILQSPGTNTISLLDCTVQNVSALLEPLLIGVSLHGLVISSGEIRDVDPVVFQRLGSPLQALGLPNNQLLQVPIKALRYLPELDRLDLSSNRMKSLDAQSFRGLRNLSFIDLSDNQLSNIAPETFDSTPILRFLRLRGNKITQKTITMLHHMHSVEELDLSSNLLSGPLGPSTFPHMSQLRTLVLAHNSFSSIKMNALQRLANLTSLSVQYNQIDVLEDHAFSHLGQLRSLNLAHNRIVAVSGASLAHLVQLTSLDLRHNFLRALTADLILPLRHLKTLQLDDNDISIVASDALKSTTALKHLTLSDNPLNCDCTLGEFAQWLTNSSLPNEDKVSMVCMTPPSLENALLIELPSNELLCTDEQQDSQPIRPKINLTSIQYDGQTIKLQWSVEERALPYTCDAFYVYEEQGQTEVLVESNPLRCNSSEMRRPAVLNVIFPAASHLQPSKLYRYCVVLFQSNKSDDLSLVLGCSEMIPLMRNTPNTLFENSSGHVAPKIMAINTEWRTQSTLDVRLNVYAMERCSINVMILEQNALLSQARVNCSQPNSVFSDLSRGPYRVCANIQPSRGTPRCISVYGSVSQRAITFNTIDIVCVSAFLFLSSMIGALIWAIRRSLLRPKINSHQCYMPEDSTCPNNEPPSTQHARYVKLQATTKV